MRDRGQYYRDTFDLEAIEVLNGPSSMLFGRGSTGGVINQVSKKANLTDSAEVTGTVGTDDRYRSTGDVNQQLTDTSAIRVNAFGQSLGSTRDVMKNKDYGIAPALRFGIGTPTEDHAVRADPAQPRHARLRRAAAERPPGAGADEHVLWPDRRPHRSRTCRRFTAAIKHKFTDDLTLRNQTQYSALDDRRARNRAASGR